MPKHWSACARRSKEPCSASLPGRGGSGGYKLDVDSSFFKYPLVLQLGGLPPGAPSTAG